MQPGTPGMDDTCPNVPVDAVLNYDFSAAYGTYPCLVGNVADNVLVPCTQIGGCGGTCLVANGIITAPPTDVCSGDTFDVSWDADETNGSDINWTLELLDGTIVSFASTANFGDGTFFNDYGGEPGPGILTSVLPANETCAAVPYDLYIRVRCYSPDNSNPVIYEEVAGTVNVYPAQPLVLETPGACNTAAMAQIGFDTDSDLATLEVVCDTQMGTAPTDQPCDSGTNMEPFSYTWDAPALEALLGGAGCYTDIVVTDVAADCLTTTCVCPDVSAAAPAIVVDSESTCVNFGDTPMGGALSAPTTACPVGSTLEYSIDGGTTWLTTLPVYDQTTAMSIDTRCLCDIDAAIFSPVTTVPTTPGVCPVCPDLTAAAPAIVVDSESVCNTAGGTAGEDGGGALSAPTTACPVGSTLEYSIDGGTTWLTTLPVYDQTTAMSIDTRCNCDNDVAVSSPVTTVPTTPGPCPNPLCPDLSAAAPAIVVDSESVCANFGDTPMGGVLSAPTTACPVGSTLEYSIDGGTTWLTTLPVYDQATAMSIDTRCLCDIDAAIFSLVTTVPTNPEVCPPCPDLTAAAPAIVIDSESVCNTAGGTAGEDGGGALSAPTAACPTGSTLEYSVDGGTTWLTTLPVYAQTTAMSIDTRCNCDIDVAISSPVTNVMTTPGACPGAVCTDLGMPCDLDGDPCTAGTYTDDNNDGTCECNETTIDDTGLTTFVQVAGTCDGPPQITLPDGYSCIYTYLVSTGQAVGNDQGIAIVNNSGMPMTVDALYDLATPGNGDAGTVTFTITTPCGNEELPQVVNYNCVGCSSSAGSFGQ